jgi:hypothetical protein
MQKEKKKEEISQFIQAFEFKHLTIFKMEIFLDKI